MLDICEIYVLNYGVESDPKVAILRFEIPNVEIPNAAPRQAGTCSSSTTAR